MSDSFPLKRLDMNVISSDSSSDDEFPVLKKSRSRTVRRGLSRNISVNNNNTVSEPVPEGSLYTTRVLKCLQDCRAGKITIQINQDETESSPDKHTQSEKAVFSNSNSTDESIEKDIQEISDSNSITSDSPPPPPPKAVTEKRRTKRMKTAFQKLDDVRNILRASTIDDDDDDVVVLEQSPLQEKQNAVIMVRYKDKIHRFHMKKLDPFCSVMAELSGILHVPENQVVLLLNDKTVSGSDTPTSLNVHVADIFECFIYTSEITEEGSCSTDSLDPDAISLCVQCQSSKSKVTLSTKKNDPLCTLMARFAVMKKIELRNLKFMFDGEDISPSACPASLDMEDGDCIDAVEL